MDVVLLMRQVLLFLHLVAFAIAFAEIIRGDWRLLRQPRLDRQALRRTAQVVGLALLALWATGLGLIALDTGLDPVAIAARPKLVAKLIVVTVLTGNGVLLHSYAFPGLSDRPLRSTTTIAVIAALGAISTVSWVYAAFVGSARLIAGVMSLEAFLALYGIGLATGVAVAVIAVAPMLRRRLDAHRPRTLTLTDDAARWADDEDGRAVGPVAAPTRKRA